LIQKTFRAHLHRRYYLELKQNTIKIQKTVKAFLKRKQFNRIKTAAIVVQSRKKKRKKGAMEKKYIFFSTFS